MALLLTCLNVFIYLAILRHHIKKSPYVSLMDRAECTVKDKDLINSMSEFACFLKRKLFIIAVKVLSNSPSSLQSDLCWCVILSIQFDSADRKKRSFCSMYYVGKYLNTYSTLYWYLATFVYKAGVYVQFLISLKERLHTWHIRWIDRNICMAYSNMYLQWEETERPTTSLDLKLDIVSWKNLAKNL